ncbi:MAG: YtxH domain-containing protein [Candidatus Eisenbacteria bacterium]
MANDSGDSTVAGLLVGVLVGAGLALILAPKAGSDTRREVGEAARKVWNGAQDQLGTVKSRLAGGKRDEGAPHQDGRDVFEQTVPARGSSEYV